MALFKETRGGEVAQTGRSTAVLFSKGSNGKFPEGIARCAGLSHRERGVLGKTIEQVVSYL